MSRIAFGLFVLLSAFCLQVFCQDMAPLAPLVESGGANSLMDLLKGDLLKQYQEAQAKDKQQSSSHRRPRPRPELGKGQFGEEPIDISKYIGTEGDPNKAVDTLRELGKIPPPQSACMPENASNALDGMLKNVPPEKRFEYALDLFQRRKFEEAQRELEQFLAEKPKEEAQFNALLMREKCLYHRRFYGAAQNDYYRLKSFYPKMEKEIGEHLDYLEEKSGIAPLKQKVMANRSDPAAQKDLLAQYEKFGWLDFAEDFFLKDIKNTSPATAKSLCEIYYKKEDYEMLATLSRAARDLHPGETAFIYNEGVALYMLGDPASRSQAFERFQKVVQETPEPRLRKNAQWYIDRMTANKMGK